MTRGGLLTLAMSGPRPSAQDVAGLLAFHRGWAGDATMTGPAGDPTGGSGGAGDGGGAGGDGSGGGADERRFTQREVEHRAAQEKAQGERAATNALLTSFGFDPATTKPEDVKALLDAKRADDAAKLSDAERDRQAAAAEKAAATAERAEVARERHELAVGRALLAAGAPADDVEDLAKLVTANVGDDADAIKAAVEALKTKRSVLFTVKTPAPHGDPGNGPAGGGGGTGKSGVARGREKAAELGWVKQPA